MWGSQRGARYTGSPRKEQGSAANESQHQDISGGASSPKGTEREPVKVILERLCFEINYPAALARCLPWRQSRFDGRNVDTRTALDLQGHYSSVHHKAPKVLTMNGDFEPKTNQEWKLESLGTKVFGSLGD